LSSKTSLGYITSFIVKIMWMYWTSDAECSPVTTHIDCRVLT